MRWTLQRKSLLPPSLTGKPIQLGPHDFKNWDAAVRRHPQRLFHTVIHLNPRREIQRCCRNVRTQRLDNGVATGDNLGVIMCCGAATAATRCAYAIGSSSCCPARSRSISLLPGLPFTLKRLPPVPPGANLIPVCCFPHGARTWFSCTLHVSRLQCVPVLVSSMVMPAAARVSRIRSAATKSRHSRAL